MNKQGMLEGVLFTVFVATTDAFVAVNAGWAFLSTPWNSLLHGSVPILDATTLVILLAFVFLEDYLGSRRYGAGGIRLWRPAKAATVVLPLNSETTPAT